MEVTINYNGQAVAVEVTLEVYEFLDRADHKAENLSHEQRRHWDGREFDEYIVAAEGMGIYYILLFIGCAGNDVICVLGSFYNSFSEKNCRMEAAGVTEKLKAHDPMRWVGLMNTLKAQAEEIIENELIYI